MSPWYKKMVRRFDDPGFDESRSHKGPPGDASVGNMMEGVIAVLVSTRGALVIELNFYSGKQWLTAIEAGQLVILKDVAFDDTVASGQNKAGHPIKTMLKRNAEQRMRVRIPPLLL